MATSRAKTFGSNDTLEKGNPITMLNWHAMLSTRIPLIVTLGAHLSLDFKMATTTIPIVTIAFDPIALGLVPSIARPGGNITGVTIAGGFEISGKRMGLLVEAMPKLSTVGYLASRPYWEDTRGAAAREPAKQAGISLKGALLDGAFNEAAYQRVFTSMEQDRAESRRVFYDERSLSCRKTDISRRMRNGSVELYSLSSAMIESSRLNR